MRDGRPALTSFHQIASEVQERITYTLGGRYDELLRWLEGYREAGSESLDHFFSRLFADVLSQAGFGFHRDLDAARAAANLVESISKFRLAFRQDEDHEAIGRDYLRMVEQGVVAAQYMASWQLEGEGVLLTPAYTFLMRNRPVDYQFWLEVGQHGLVGAPLSAADASLCPHPPLARGQDLDRWRRIRGAPDAPWKSCYWA